MNIIKNIIYDIIILGGSMEHVVHSIGSVYDNNSKILILGTFPSIQSRKTGFYYGNPQNRFWKVLSIVFHEKEPKTTEEKLEFLKKFHIALWDVIASCDIKGSSDSSIRNPIINDIASVLQNSKIDRIYTTGKKAYDLYNKYCYPTIKVEAIMLPSPSPANCTMSLEQLIEIYSCLYM